MIVSSFSVVQNRRENVENTRIQNNNRRWPLYTITFLWNRFK